jgi:CheY-like chemotaxis protein
MSLSMAAAGGDWNRRRTVFMGQLVVPDSGPAATALTILLVEDNSADAQLVQDMLKDASHTPIAVTHVARLHEALGYLRTQPVSAMLLDLTLPDSDGLDTLLRATAEVPHTPIVVLTGIDDEAVAAKAVREGAQDYLVKGQVDGRLLHQSLRYAVERHAFAEALRRSESRYRTLTEGSMHGIVIHVDGVVRLANRALAGLLGVDRADELIQTPIWSFITPRRPSAHCGDDAWAPGAPASP